MSDDLTLRILGEIRDDVRGLREELHTTRTELRAEIAETRTSLRAEIAETRSELRSEIATVRRDLVESEVRLSTAFVNLTASTRDVYDLLTERFDLRDRVDRCEHDIAALKKHVDLP